MGHIPHQHSTESKETREMLTPGVVPGNPGSTEGTQWTNFTVMILLENEELHICNRFGHRAVEKKVMENIGHAADLLHFPTDGVVILPVLSILGVEKVKDIASPL